jgi:hypothetical protein
MLRKLVLCAVVALVPGLAFAAATGTNGAASNDTHVTGAEVKTDAAVKADVKDSAVKADVKSDDAAKTKAVHHRDGHKAGAKVKTDTKAGTENSSKL